MITVIAILLSLFQLGTFGMFLVSVPEFKRQGTEKPGMAIAVGCFVSSAFIFWLGVLA